MLFFYTPSKLLARDQAEQAPLQRQLYLPHVTRGYLPTSRRMLARAETEQAALGKRASDLAEAEGRLLSELRDLEAAVADRWEQSVKKAASVFPKHTLCTHRGVLYRVPTIWHIRQSCRGWPLNIAPAVPPPCHQDFVRQQSVVHEPGSATMAARRLVCAAGGPPQVRLLRSSSLPGTACPYRDVHFRCRAWRRRRRRRRSAGLVMPLGWLLA